VFCLILAVLFVAEVKGIRPARARVGARSRIVVEITIVRGKGSAPGDGEELEDESAR
jgi:hypothetical protein